MSTPEQHLANIELEIAAMSLDGHLKDIELSRFINAIEYDVLEARRAIENGRQHNRGSDIQEPGRGSDD